MIKQPNDDQRVVYIDILNSIMFEQESKSTCTEKCFYIDGPGGAGKKFLYNAMYYKLRELDETVACVVWTGIAAILLPRWNNISQNVWTAIRIAKRGYNFFECIHEKLTF